MYLGGEGGLQVLELWDELTLVDLLQVEVSLATSWHAGELNSLLSHLGVLSIKLNCRIDGTVIFSPGNSKNIYLEYTWDLQDGPHWVIGTLEKHILTPRWMDRCLRRVHLPVADL